MATDRYVVCRHGEGGVNGRNVLLSAVWAAMDKTSLIDSEVLQGIIILGNK